jgi:hypothetical protein
MSVLLEELKVIMSLTIKEGRAMKVLNFMKQNSENQNNKLAKEISIWLIPKLEKPEARKLTYWSYVEVKEIVKTARLKHYYYPKQEQYKEIEGDIIRTLNYALTEKVFRKAGKLKLLEKYQLYERMFDIKSLKNLSDYMKIGGPNVEKDWKLLVNCDTLFGWGEPAEKETIIEAIKGWTSIPYEPWWKGKIDDTKYYEEFKTASEKMLRWRTDEEPNTLDLETFLDAIPLMGTTGSGYNPVDKATMEVTAYDEKLKISNNKYKMAASMSTEKKKIRMKEMRHQKAKVSQKLELYPKMRIIVSGEFWLSMRMRWVRQWIDKWLKGSGWSTLWSTKKQLWEMWNKSTNMTEGVKCPLDQAKFDWHANKKQIKIMLESILSLIQAKANDKEMEEVMKSIIYAMEEGQILYEGVSYPWNSGILSGWDWTAMLDTMFNYTEFLMAIKIANEYSPTKINWVNVQGDDQNIETKDWRSTLSYWAAMESMNIDVHPSKNFFSDKHNEYLRKGMDEKGSNGYPLRMINSMVWHYPGSPFERKPTEKLKNLWSNWAKLGERLNTDLTQMFYEDARGAKIKKEFIEAYPHMARTAGGAGIKPLNDLMFKNEGGFWLIKPKIGKAPGYEDFQHRFGEYQSRELENWMLGAVNTPDHTKEHELKQEEETELMERPKWKEKNFIMTKGVRMPKIGHITGFPTQVMFGSSDEFMRKIFPGIDSFTDHGRAPKRWIYDMLLGKVKDVTPRVDGLSDEMASLLWSQYSPSMYNAMYVQKTTPNKWDSLNLFAENHFNDFVHNNKLSPYTMVG